MLSSEDISKVVLASRMEGSLVSTHSQGHGEETLALYADSTLLHLVDKWFHPTFSTIVSSLRKGSGTVRAQWSKGVGVGLSRVLVEFEFWHPVTTSHISDFKLKCWKRERGREAGESGSPSITEALCCPSSAWLLHLIHFFSPSTVRLHVPFPPPLPPNTLIPCLVWFTHQSFFNSPSSHVYLHSTIFLPLLMNCS